jgi:uncharacterized protein YqeY
MERSSLDPSSLKSSIKLKSGQPSFAFSTHSISRVAQAMSLKDQITEDMKTAMRARETDRLGTIRLLLAAIKQREVDERVTLDDAAITAIIDKMIKQRKDSISQFQAAQRDDLVAKENAELDVLGGYMPEQLSDEAVAAEVQAAIEATGAAGPQDMGKVMGVLKAKLAGRVDMTVVSGLVKAALAK